MENIEILENRANGHAQGNTTNRTQIVAQSSRNQKKAQPSQQKARQRERLAVLGTSAVAFAHEVGNPLQAIFGTLELIETQFKSRQTVDCSLMPMIQVAMRELDRLRALLRQFRGLANSQHLDLQRVDLAKLIGDVLALQQLGHRAAGIAVKFECETPLPHVMVDADKITQMILNLFKNAIEAMPNGGSYRSECTLRGR